MESYLFPNHYDLITPDGKIIQILSREDSTLEVIVLIEDISPAFIGFSLDEEDVHFNIKSSVAQLGLDGIGTKYDLDPKTNSARITVTIISRGPLGKKLLQYLEPGAYIGKLFAADPRRRVRDPDYLLRMFGRVDRDGLPLLSLGGMQGDKHLRLEKIEGHTVAFLNLKNGTIEYDPSTEYFLPTLAAALHFPFIKTRELLFLHQKWKEGKPRIPQKDDILLVRTLPLHIRTAFGRVINSLLPEGIQHTSACVLEPTTKASGDVYEVFGESKEEITQIPLEFYTLEPHREHVFFSDRDQLQSSLDDPSSIFKAFETAPRDPAWRTAFFIVKGEQMLKLTSDAWIKRKVLSEEFPGLFDLQRQSQLVQSYIEQQPSYPFLKAIEQGLITSQGVLFSRYFPSPLMKKMLLGDMVQSSLKAIYFEHPSQSNGEFFSHEDRSSLLDLAKFAIPVFWADRVSGKILQFALKPEKDTGMFVPTNQVDEFVRSTSFGVYGSSMLEMQFEKELTQILEGVLALRKTARHPLLNPDTPLALITGGGPGLMEVGNRVAKEVNILSCANIVDFSELESLEQTQNPYIEAKMTYRLDRLVERQAEFNLDFPIFLMGGYGTDFEFSLEQVRRKVHIGPPTPILLLGPHEYWKRKIHSNFQTNLQSGTITGVEWISNCFYCVQTASEALKVYKQFFAETLPIGKNAPPAKDGFITVGLD